MSISLALFALAIQSPPQAIDHMSDVKGDIVYADRIRKYFIITLKGTAYIGHPVSEGSIAGEDVQYSRAKFSSCSTPKISCTQAGFLLFVRPTSDGSPLSLSSRDFGSSWPTVVSAWRTGGGWTGVGLQCEYVSEDQKSNGNCQPSATYQYEMNAAGVVTRIILTYWTLAKHPVTYDLRLETKKGIGS